MLGSDWVVGAKNEARSLGRIQEDLVRLCLSVCCRCALSKKKKEEGLIRGIYGNASLSPKDL